MAKKSVFQLWLKYRENAPWSTPWYYYINVVLQRWTTAMDYSDADYIGVVPKVPGP